MLQGTLGIGKSYFIQVNLDKSGTDNSIITYIMPFQGTSAGIAIRADMVPTGTSAYNIENRTIKMRQKLVVNNGLPYGLEACLNADDMAGAIFTINIYPMN